MHILVFTLIHTHRPSTVGFELCGDKTVKDKWWFSHQDLEDLGFTPKMFAHGISYISLGHDARANIWTGNDFDGAELKLKKASENDLTKEYINKEDDVNWNDKMNSLLLVFPANDEDNDPCLLIND